MIGADPGCSFMPEARRGYYFLDDITDECSEAVQRHNEQKIHILATHGYSPKKADYHTIFMAAGKGIKKGVTVSNMNLVDIGPTLAALLGLNLDYRYRHVKDEFLDQ